MPETYSVGDRVQVLNVGPGVIAAINAEGRYDVNLDGDQVADASKGHASLRSNVVQPAVASVYDVSAERLQRLA